MAREKANKLKVGDSQGEDTGEATAGLPSRKLKARSCLSAGVFAQQRLHVNS